MVSPLIPHAELNAPQRHSDCESAARLVDGIQTLSLSRDTANSNFLKVRYAATEVSSAKSARARGAYLRVSFKNTRETAFVPSKVRPSAF
jgi:hypothetical protein